MKFDTTLGCFQYLDIKHKQSLVRISRLNAKGMSTKATRKEQIKATHL